MIRLLIITETHIELSIDLKQYWKYCGGGSRVKGQLSNP